MKTFTKFAAVMCISLMVGGTVLSVAPVNSNMTVSAATKKAKIQRGQIWGNFNHRTYKVRNTKAKTYAISGKANNLKMKANHNLKNYKNKTWTRMKLTEIKQNDNWNVYYFVKTGKISGWVKLDDVKLKHPVKAAKDTKPEFDVYYHKLSKKQRNNYYKYVLVGGAGDANGEPTQTAWF